MTTETIRLAAVDDHPVVVEGIAAILTRLGPEFEWLGAASSYDSLRTLVESSPVAPDVVLYDLHLHDDSTSGDGIAWLAEQDIRSVILTSDIRPIPIRDAVTAGAQGVILKSDAPESIIDVLRQVHAGDFAVSSELAHLLVNDDRMAPHLAKREREALELLESGLPRKVIGSKMDPPIAMSTVVTYLNRICARYRDLGRPVNGPADALRAAAADGYLDPPEPDLDL
ncbi:MAG: response regulator transcription factor [Tetrasphaera jenkinsii]|nr:response regulator transcription factor [Tetrasphaera jenkinsii]